MEKVLQDTTIPDMLKTQIAILQALGDTYTEPPNREPGYPRDTTIPQMLKVQQQILGVVKGKLPEREEAAQTTSAEIDRLKKDLSAASAALAEQQKINAEQSLEIEKLKAAAEGNLYMFKQDAAASYEKAVPADAMKWATLDQIGGRTLVWNQLVDADTTSVSPTAGRKYCTRIGGAQAIITSDGTDIAVTGGTDMVFDLTAMFGAGNEPSTPQEIRALFPADYYPYSAPTLMSFSNAAVVSRGRNLFDMSKVDGTGFSAQPDGSILVTPDARTNNATTSKKFREIADLKIGDTYTLTLDKGTPGIGRGIHLRGSKFTWNNGESLKITAQDLSGPISIYGAGTEQPDIVSNIQIVRGTDVPASYTPYRPVIHYDTSAIVQKYFPDGMRSVGSVYDEIDLERMVAIQRVGSVDETGLAYAVLDTPIETPITEAFDPSIQVESGGTLTFENDQGENFHVPVPNQETCMMKLTGGASE